MSNKPPGGADYPWSWDPMMRLDQSNDLFEAVIFDPQYEDGNRDAVAEFCRKSEQRYVIPQHAADALDATVLGLPKGEIGECRWDMLVERNDERPHRETVKAFEKDILKLKPTRTIDGVRYFESAAGFAGGNYPAESVAQSVSISADELLSMLDDDETTFKYVMLRSANFLFSVYAAPRSKGNVGVADVYELSPLGSAVVEAALGAYAIGLKNAAEQQ